MNADRYYLLGPDPCSRTDLRRLRPTVLRSSADVRRALHETAGASLWLARRAETVQWISEALEGRENGRARRALFADFPLRADDLVALFQGFGRVVCPPFSFLPEIELAGALASDDREDRCIAGLCDARARRVVLIRGDLRSITVPLAWCKPRPAGPLPDAARFAVIASGDAFALGDWECTFDAVLYEWDEEFRRRLNARRRATDRTFGAALRRLRIQKEVHQDQFPPLPAKTVTRIERGAVRKPHRRTLAILAERLGVRPEEIATY